MSTWVKVPKKELKIIIGKFASFTENAFFLRQKAIAPGKIVTVSRDHISDLLDRMPEDKSPEVIRAVESLRKSLAQ